MASRHSGRFHQAAEAAGRAEKDVTACGYAWRKAIRRAGYDKASRIGYLIGLNHPPDWGERTASLREGDQTVLEPNMRFHMIPDMWIDDWGYELGETFCLGETDTPEILTASLRAQVIAP